jgi:hypothetical protein
MITTRRTGTAAALAAVLVLGSALPAAATVNWTVDNFSQCSGSCRQGAARGTITWGNRTAYVSGTVTDVAGDLHTTVTFDAYAGNTLVDHQTRTASVTTKPYGFPIGDPDLVGGVNRVLIEVCTATLGLDSCSGWSEERRD